MQEAGRELTKDMRAGQVAAKAENPIVVAMDQKKTAFLNLIRGPEMTEEQAVEWWKHFRAIVLSELSEKPNLAACSPQSFLTAAFKCAKLGLYPGPEQHVAFIPYAGKVDLQVMYRGYAHLMRTADPGIANIRPYVVYANDAFDVDYGMEPWMTHKPMIKGPRGAILAAYCIIDFTDGRPQYFIVAHKDDIDKRRSASPAFRKGEGPWLEWEDEMTRKTPVKMIASLAPLKSRGKLALAEAIDDGIEVEGVPREEVPGDAEVIGSGPAPTKPAATELPAGEQATKPSEKPPDKGGRKATKNQTSMIDQRLATLKATREQALQHYFAHGFGEGEACQFEDLTQREAGQFMKWLKTSVSKFDPQEPSQDPERDFGDEEEASRVEPLATPKALVNEVVALGWDGADLEVFVANEYDGKLFSELTPEQIRDIKLALNQMIDAQNQ